MDLSRITGAKKQWPLCQMQKLRSEVNNQEKICYNSFGKKRYKKGILHFIFIPSYFDS